MSVDVTDELGNRLRLSDDALVQVGKTWINVAALSAGVPAMYDASIVMRTNADVARHARLKAAQNAGRLPAPTEATEAPVQAPTTQRQHSGVNAPKGSVRLQCVPLQTGVRVLWEVVLPGKSDKAVRMLERAVLTELVDAGAHLHVMGGMTFADMADEAYMVAKCAILDLCGGFGVTVDVRGL